MVGLQSRGMPTQITTGATWILLVKEADPMRKHNEERHLRIEATIRMSRDFSKMKPPSLPPPCTKAGPVLSDLPVSQEKSEIQIFL